VAHGKVEILLPFSAVKRMIFKIRLILDSFAKAFGWQMVSCPDGAFGAFATFPSRRQRLMFRLAIADQDRIQLPA
jgi:hypothetical protein